MEKRHRGFTLIEVITVVAMMAIFSLGVYYFESGNFKVYSYEKEEADIQFDCKTAVTQIAQDIKQAKQSPYSIKTERFDIGTRFDNLFNIQLGSNYTPLIYIEQIDGEGCMYALKKIGSETELVRIELTTNSFSLDKDADNNVQNTRSILNYNDDNTTGDYVGKKLAADKFNNEIGHLDVPSNWIGEFIYEENGEFYLVYNINDGKHYEVRLEEKANYILKANSEKVIAKNVDVFPSDKNYVEPLNYVLGKDDTSEADDNTQDYKSNAYNIFITLTSKKYPSITKSYTMCVSKIKYSGDD